MLEYTILWLQLKYSQSMDGGQMYRMNYSVADLVVTFSDVLILNWFVRFNLIYFLPKACLWWEFYGFSWVRLKAFNVGLFVTERVMWPSNMRMDIMELEKLFLALTRKTAAAFTQIHLVAQNYPSVLHRRTEQRMSITSQVTEHANSNFLHCSVIYGYISRQLQPLFFLHIVMLHSVTLQVKLFHSKVFLLEYNAVYSVESYYI
jgi:hypothetical protein